MDRIEKTLSRGTVVLIVTLFLAYLGIFAYDRISQSETIAVYDETAEVQDVGQFDQNVKVVLDDPEKLPDADGTGLEYHDDSIRSAQLQNVIMDLSEELEE